MIILFILYVYITNIYREISKERFRIDFCAEKYNKIHLFSFVPARIDERPMPVRERLKRETNVSIWTAFKCNGRDASNGPTV